MRRMIDGPGRIGARILLSAVAVCCLGRPASADIGKDAFEARCASCHTLTGVSTPSGPSLKGVVWRKIASLPDFAYSGSLKAQIGTWSPDRLDAYLKDTQAFAPGTSMFWDISDASIRRSIVNYLKSVK